MPTYPYAVNPPITLTGVGPTSAYSALDEADVQLLAYGAIAAFINVAGTNLASNYRLAFSTSNPTPHPSIGQLWPRGAGEA